jgi:hypothetical protein
MNTLKQWFHSLFLFLSIWLLPSLETYHCFTIMSPRQYCFNILIMISKGFSTKLDCPRNKHLFPLQFLVGSSLLTGRPAWERYGLHTYCTMLGYLDQFWSPTVPCYSTGDAIQIVNWLYYNLRPHVTTFTYNHLLRCYTFTQLTILHVRNYNHLLHSYTSIFHSWRLHIFPLQINIQFTLRANCDIFFVRLSLRSDSVNSLLKTRRTAS